MEVGLTETDRTCVAEYLGVVELQAPSALFCRGAAVGEFAMETLPPSLRAFQLAVGPAEPDFERGSCLVDAWGIFKLILHAFMAKIRRDRATLVG